MKTITINKVYNQESTPQDFSYTDNAPLGHIKKHLASEIGYARKGHQSVLTKGTNPVDIKIFLVESTGLSAEESAELTTFLENL